MTANKSYQESISRQNIIEKLEDIFLKLDTIAGKYRITEYYSGSPKLKKEYNQIIIETLKMIQDFVLIDKDAVFVEENIEIKNAEFIFEALIVLGNEYPKYFEKLSVMDVWTYAILSINFILDDYNKYQKVSNKQTKTIYYNWLSEMFSVILKTQEKFKV